MADQSFKGKYSVTLFLTKTGDYNHPEMRLEKEKVISGGTRP